MANQLFAEADINKDGKLQLSELRSMLNSASKQYSHFAEHARFLDGCARAKNLHQFGAYLIHQQLDRDLHGCASDRGHMTDAPV